METAVNKTISKKDDIRLPNLNDQAAIEHMKYAQGLGASLRYANELRAVSQVGRLAPLKSSNLHEDVLRGQLGAGSFNIIKFE